MMRKYYFLNAILITIAVLLGNKLYGVISKPVELFPAVKRQDASAPGSVKESLPEKKNELFDYQVIVRKDLFRPERKEPEAGDSFAGTVPPKLIGILIKNDGARAFLMDSVTKVTRTYKQKETISGYTVHEILENKVILMKGGEKIDLKIVHVEAIAAPGRAGPDAAPRSATQDQAVEQVQDQQAAAKQQGSGTQPPPLYIPPRQSAPISLQQHQK
jgi:type II secretory pathway component PulC